MTRPTARVLALLELLQSGGIRTVPHLADRLGVDERTVRRYSAHLTELGIPVLAVRGRHGGYRLAPGYRMPPLMLTDEEALAVLLGLIVSRRAGLVTTSAAATESAAAKIRRVLPDALKRRLDTLLETIEFTAPNRPVIEPGTAVLLLLAEAARNRRPVTFTYTTADGRRTQRTVHPYGIVAHAGRWYLSGEDSRIEAVRTFRLDRITTLQSGSGTFELPEDFDPTAQVLSGIAEAPHRHSVSVRVQGTADAVRTRFPAGIAIVTDTPDHDGWVQVRLQVEDLNWVPAVLAALDAPFIIDGPPELQHLVQSVAARLSAAAGELSGRHLGQTRPAEAIASR